MKTTRRFLVGPLLLLTLFLWPEVGAAQLTWRDLVFNGGISVEKYQGNLPAVTISAVDSTEEASAAVGELGVRGGLYLLNGPERSLELQFDGGLRQFVAGGFELRDYAPREWVGRTNVWYREAVGSLGTLFARGGVGLRKVEDRPPMPLFIQPSYTTFDGELGIQFQPLGATYLDLRAFGERADYPVRAATPQLNLLDRQLLGGEVGATWGSSWTIRVHSSFRALEYRHQGTFDPEDPFRRDNGWSLGATWTHRGQFFAQVGLEGIRNRSNSSRSEYDAVSLRSVFSAPLPMDFTVNFLANLTDKHYLTKTDFARLVPGEEADNASVVYLEVARPFLVNLDGALRFGWNRAETDTGEDYSERYGMTFLLRYRPWGR